MSERDKVRGSTLEQLTGRLRENQRHRSGRNEGQIESGHGPVENFGTGRIPGQFRRALAEEPQGGKEQPRFPAGKTMTGGKRYRGIPF
jgi:hypothetical protein